MSSHPCRHFRTLLLALLIYALMASASAQIVDTPNTLYQIARTGNYFYGRQPDKLPLELIFAAGIVRKDDRLWLVEPYGGIVSQVLADGRVEQVAGLAGVCGADVGNSKREDARFCSPQGIAIDSKGTVYISDTLNNTIRKIGEKSVVTVVGQSSDCQYFYEINAQLFCYTKGITFDSKDNLYAVSPYGVVYKINPLTGEAKIFAGSSNIGCRHNGDYQVENALLCNPKGIAIHNETGNLYVADTGNHVIRKITPQGVISTLAGKRTYCGASDGKDEARFCRPSGVAVDAAGNVYVADTGNNAIRKIDLDGKVSTLAGQFGSKRTSLGPLPGPIAQPTGIALIGSRQLAITTVDTEVLGINF
jgi:serine/threonine-protein kinase